MPRASQGIPQSVLTDLETLIREMQHETYIFPEDTDETVTFTAAAGAHDWSTWTEIVDNNAVTFSSKLTTLLGHISGVTIETADTNSARYLVEISYGDAHVLVSSTRIYTGGPPLQDMKQETKVRAQVIPAGETSTIEQSALLPD